MAAAGAVAAVAVAAAFSAAFVNAVNVDAGNDKIAANLGLTEEQSKRAGSAAAAAYANAFGESMEAVQATTEGVIGSIEGMRDASVEELQGIVEGVQAMGDGFQIETGRISQIVGQMISTDMVASAEEGLDLLTAALQKVPPAVREDLMDAVDEYGPFFQAIGFSGEEAMGALVTASEKGMYGIDKTGDAVKEFGIRATDMSTTSVAAYEAAGLSAEDMSAKILAGGEEGKEGFQQIIDGLLGIEDPVARANAAIGLFGTPLEDLGVNEIPTFLASLGDASGAMGDFAGANEAYADSLGTNVKSQWESITRTIETFATQIASYVLPILEGFFSWLAENPTVAQALAVALGVLTAVVLGLAAALWVASLTPITLIIAAIIVGIGLLVAAITWLVLNWDAVWAWLSETWTAFSAWFMGVLDGFVQWWNGMWEGFASWVTQVWEGFIGWITGLWEGFVGWLKGVGDGLASWWNGLWAGIGAWITAVWEGFVGWVQGVVGGFVGFLIGAFNGYVSFWAGLWEGVRSTIVSVWEGIVSWFQGIPQTIMNVFAGAGQWLMDSGRAIIQGLIDGIQGMIGAVGDAVGGVMDFVAGFFPNSPAKHGPFSGSGWTRLLGSGSAIMEQFAEGMHTVDPFDDASLRGTVLGRMVMDGSAESPSDATESAGGTGGTLVYVAAENQSLSAEEALFAALGSPRSPFGGES
jgi:phage-related minor tail protein